MSRPALSVLIDTYNHERYIEQCVLSAIEQDFPQSEYEILVVDDGSTDRTAELVRNFAPRVRLLSKSNGGQASAFNTGVREARGEVVALLDGDDWFAPGKLNAVAEAFEREPNAVAISHGYYEYHDETGETLARVPAEERRFSAATPASSREASEAWRSFLIGALTVSRGFLQSILPISEELVFSADCPISRAAASMGTYVLAQPLFYYRHHATNLYIGASGSMQKTARIARMQELAYGEAVRVLNKLGLSKDVVYPIGYEPWILEGRQNLRTYGGSRLSTLRTEMHAFPFDYAGCPIYDRAARFIAISALALLFAPQKYYKIRDWYFQRGMRGIFREIGKSV